MVRLCRRAVRTLAVAAALTATLALGAPLTAPGLHHAEAHHAPRQGFGATTPGGAGRAVVRVTNLNDSGPGSLREAVSGANRTVVFDVAGQIALTDYIRVLGSFVTIDGASAPAPGITLRGHGLAIEGRAGAHDVIVHGIRVRGAAKDGIRVAYGAHHVVLDHVSVQGSGDGNIDISESSDVTVQWSILAEPALDEKNQLIKYHPARITLHHNLYTEARQRNPQVRIDDAGSPATDTTVDMRNNVVWGWVGGYGTLIWYGPRGNVVANLYSSPASSSAEQARAIQVSNGAHAYVTGNVSLDGVGDVNAAGNETGPFPAPAVTTTSACEAAAAVVADAGVRPLDAVDARYVDAVSLAECGDTAPPAPAPPPAVADLVISAVSAPSSASAGGAIGLSVTTRNAGTGAAGGSSTRLYLSTDATVGSGDVALGTVSVPSLAAGASTSGSLTVTVPAATAAGSYRLLARADAGATVAESNESNNTAGVALTVTSTGGITPTGTPDLVISAVTAPTGATAGGAVAVTVTTRNGGAAAAGSSSTRLYLSTDTAVDAADVTLGTMSVPALAAGASASTSQTLTIPATTPGGTYRLVARADAAGAVAETSESNNTASVALTVSTSPGSTPTGGRVDLVVKDLSAPRAARPGASFTAKDRVVNRGSAAAPATTVKFYLSVDGRLGAGDVLLGARSVPPLAAGASSQGATTLTVPAATRLGSYHILAVADADGVVVETDEDNVRNKEFNVK